MTKKFILFVLVVTPLFLGGLFSVIKNFKEQRDEIVANLIQEAIVASGGHEYYILKTKELLQSTSALPSVKNNNKNSCNKELSLIMKNLQDKIYTVISIADVKGDIWCSSVYLPEDGINIADRLYFKRAMETRSFSVGEYQVGRLSGIKGITFASPLISEGGEVKGIVTAHINLQELTKYFAVGSNPQIDSVYMLLNSEGVLLARLPTNAEVVGKHLDLSSEKSFFNVLQNKTAMGLSDGIFEGDGLTGVWRVFAFTKVAPKIAGLDNTSLFLLVGYKKSDFYAPVYFSLFKQLGSLAGLILASGIIFFLIQRQQKTL